MHCNQLLIYIPLKFLYKDPLGSKILEPNSLFSNISINFEYPVEIFSQISSLCNAIIVLDCLVT